MLIGLTGPYCAGKNFAASLLEQRGLAVLDVDKLGHAAIETKKEAILSRFGRDLERQDGSVDRRQLGKRVFGKKEELAALEAIVHPEANRLTEEWIAGHGKKPCVINAALLHRTSRFGQFDAIIVVTAPFLTRLLRARKRDRLSWLALLKRFASQRNFAAQYLSGNADIYRVGNPGLRNSGKTKAKLEREIGRILRIFDKKFGSNFE